MNRTIIIFNLLVSLVSLGKPIDETTKSKSEDEYSKIDDTFIADNSKENEDILTIATNKDDVLTISDLSKVYSSMENLFAKTRYLKEQPENDAFEKPDLKEKSRRGQKSKIGENLDLGDRNIATIKVESRAGGKDENKPPQEERKSLQVQPKTDTREKSKTVAVESKVGSKEESKSLETTSEFSEWENTTPTYRIDDKSADYLENDKEDYSDYEKVAPVEKPGRRNLEILNDESNSAWDLLDDIPSTRRMFTPHDNLNTDSKEKTGDEHLRLLKANLSKPNFKLSAIYNQHGLTQQPTISVAQIHPALARRRLQIIPGFITVRTAVPIDFRRILSQERNHLIYQNIPYETAENSEMFPESRDIEDFNSEQPSNAYPYTPVESVAPKTTEVSTANTVFAKLAQASENPQKITHSSIGGNAKVSSSVPYSIRPYKTVPNYDVYKYVTGFGRSP